MYDWRTCRSSIFKNNVHLVFVTKYRRGVFTKEMLERTEAIMKETCEQMDCELLEFGGEDDHIHMMVSVHPKLAISNLVSKLKGKSSYMIRREYWDRVKTMLWGNHFLVAKLLCGFLRRGCPRCCSGVHQQPERTAQRKSHEDITSVEAKKRVETTCLTRP